MILVHREPPQSVYTIIKADPVFSILGVLVNTIADESKHNGGVIRLSTSCGDYEFADMKVTQHATDHRCALEGGNCTCWGYAKMGE